MKASCLNKLLRLNKDKLIAEFLLSEIEEINWVKGKYI